MHFLELHKWFFFLFGEIEFLIFQITFPSKYILLDYSAVASSSENDCSGLKKKSKIVYLCTLIWNNLDKYL